MNAVPNPSTETSTANAPGETSSPRKTLPVSGVGTAAARTSAVPIREAAGQSGGSLEPAAKAAAEQPASPSRPPGDTDMPSGSATVSPSIPLATGSSGPAGEGLVMFTRRPVGSSCTGLVRDSPRPGSKRRPPQPVNGTPVLT